MGIIANQMALELFFKRSRKYRRNMRRRILFSGKREGKILRRLRGFMIRFTGLKKKDAGR